MAIQKTAKATDDLIGNKIAQRIAEAAVTSTREYSSNPTN